ncbi:carboxypeptidase-like regulatory domain-containing protein [Zunongwangia sp. SCSIO 43204]|uniref:Kelch repeat-containing protein n=1 Tax=Zunongwangia sp. SCSIO 43204 TaxID=2779359 RepID=UPI001CA7F8A6|nr:carboxypeptidase-like regulatory domain-containing protein [Zunongwangia sp. SCSIO 43204]UAB85461.1 carboxypeptidase-like regulatory domain-containing protein [Zunongwangia sp. SCSIO 43204]
MKNSILFSLVIIFCSQSFAQQLKGKVLDADTNNPLEGVHIYYTNQKAVEITDKQGNFSIKYRKEHLDDSIHFSILNYKKTAISLRDLISRKSPILLEQTTESLTEVTISSQTKHFKNVPYKKLENLPYGLFEFGSVLKDGKIYIIAGNSTRNSETLKGVLSMDNLNMVDPNAMTRKISLSRAKIDFNDFKGDLLIYDIAKNHWTKKFKKTFAERVMNGMLAYKEKFYVFGGKTLSRNGKFEYLDNTIEIYDPKTDSILVDETNPHMAVNAASFVYENKLVIMGGSVKKNRERDTKVYTNKVHLQDLETGLWYELGNMPEAKEIQGILIDNKFYMVGGFAGKKLTGIESYDLNTRKWQREAVLFQGMAQPALASAGDLLYIYDEGKICTYNLITKSLKEYHIPVKRQASAMHIYENKLILIGGVSSYNYNFLPRNSVYQIKLEDIEHSEVMQSKNFGALANY